MPEQQTPRAAGPAEPPWPAGRYRKRPVVIDAVQLGLAEYADDPWQAWRCELYPAWLSIAATEIVVVDELEHPRLAPIFSSEDYWYFDVVTLEGVHRGGPDDWLIRGVAGELYFCKDAIFRATYELELDEL